MLEKRDEALALQISKFLTNSSSLIVLKNLGMAFKQLYLNFVKRTKMGILQSLEGIVPISIFPQPVFQVGFIDISVLLLKNTYRTKLRF